MWAFPEGWGGRIGGSRGGNAGARLSSAMVGTLDIWPVKVDGKQLLFNQDRVFRKAECDWYELVMNKQKNGTVI